MRVILTHEQADFDALGSLLGAALLDEQAVAVLPRRINRNGRAFINLYGPELPFTDGRYLPPEPVDTVILVDTQSLITVKGMSSRTQVRVIDHHPTRPDLPENWAVTTSRLGACTTFFVERLRDQNSDLSVVQATLLLLGIYEDTGSLTYISTTSSDVQAAAYLLEQGASLQILNDYLNPPLSIEQRRIYDLLLREATIDTIQGQKIVVAHASSEEMTDEISSVAHKLRDLLDPDALFLLVHTPEGIRLVARSTTDQVNVAAVAAHFGGGGHDRAASALIRTENLPSAEGGLSPLENVRQELLNILPKYVHPSVTVAQLMSRQPLVLKPTTPASEAGALMQRYGYEGYPVVEDGKVIGLLTRRAVDRALAHKLNLTAGSLMEAGEVTVTPSDAVEHLQKVMTSTGWGQVPVVDPQSGKIVGIVTRTDLLKTLSHGARASERQNLADQLETVLPAGRLALLRIVAAQAHHRHMAAYIVGGFVRDVLLGRPSPDFDIVVEGDAIALGRDLAHKFGGRIVSHSRFGTAKWRIAENRQQIAQRIRDSAGALIGNAIGDLDSVDLPDSLDLITARTEFYDYPTALPTVERSSIKLDLRRRDFTINTLALRLDGRHYGELYDYWGGVNDLNRGLVRVLHSLSFVDDPTRILRAVRFEQRFGFRIEDRTLRLMKEARPLLRQVSGDRIRHELDLILSEENPTGVLQRLEELDLLSAIHPGLSWQSELAGLLTRVLQGPVEEEWGIGAEMLKPAGRRSLGYMVWLSQLPASTISAVSRKLHFNHQLRRALEWISVMRNRLPELVHASPSQVVERFEDVPAEVFFILYTSDSREEVRHFLWKYVTEWRKVQSVIRGDDLQRMGIPPGPVYRKILGALRAAWLDGTVSSAEEEKELLKKLYPTECKGDA